MRAGTQVSRGTNIFCGFSNVRNNYLSVICSPSGKGILSGHADGTIIRYFFEEEGAGLTRVCANYRQLWYHWFIDIFRDPFAAIPAPHMLLRGVTPLSLLLGVTERSLSTAPMVCTANYNIAILSISHFFCRESGSEFWPLFGWKREGVYVCLQKS